MELDRVELQDSARRIFSDTGLAPDRDKSWGLAVEMGWLGLSAPEELGGLEQGRPALCTLYAELGRVLAGAPFLPAMLAIEAVCKAPELADRQAWLDRLIAGELTTASLRPAPLSAKATADGYALSGTLSAAPDADKASHVLVWAEGESLLGLLPLDQAGARLEPRKSWDGTRQLFDVRLDGARLGPDLVLARGEAAAGLARELEAHLLLALAADCMGAAQALFELTVEYLQTRRQFARPLAMFQALKHRCADLRAQVSAVEALLWRTAEQEGHAVLDPVAEAGALKSFAATVFHDVAEEAIQLHGGIGLTAEHPCHLFVKRALLNESLGGERDAWEAAAGAQAIGKLARR
jgi:alkylation response protein AidB-like acyl-CoA dehydrogenase